MTIYILGFLVLVIAGLWGRNAYKDWQLKRSELINSALNAKVEEQGFIINKEKQHEAIKNSNAADLTDLDERLRDKNYFER